MDVTAQLHAELDAVTGDRCGWTCHHHGDNFPPCQRAAGHAGAVSLVDMHLARGEDGALVVADETCCATSEAGSAGTAEAAVPAVP